MRQASALLPSVLLEPMVLNFHFPVSLMGDILLNEAEINSPIINQHVDGDVVTFKVCED